MKLLNYLTVLCIAVFAAACSNDDEPKTEEGAKVEVSGTYQVEASLFVKGNPQGEPAPVAVSVDVKNGKATIVTPAMGEGHMSLPEVTIKDVTVTKGADNVFTFSKPAFDIVINETKFTITVVETCKIVDGKMDFQIDFKPAGMPMSISCKFVTK